jgi:hypothetical protein
MPIITKYSIIIPSYILHASTTSDSGLDRGLYRYASARFSLHLRHYNTLHPHISIQQRYFSYHIGDTNLSISDLSIILTLAIIFTNVGIFFSNFKFVTFSNRVTSLIASMGISLSMVALSFSTEFQYYVLLYGPVYGFFIGYGYMAPIKNCYDHLPNRKGI